MAISDKLKVQVLGWLDQEVDNAITWHRANNADLRPEQIEAFKAGYRQGYLKGITNLAPMVKG